MRGTEAKPARCVELVGETGKSVTCSIYERRSSTRREFEAGSERCIEAREALGFAPLPASFTADVSPDPATAETALQTNR